MSTVVLTPTHMASDHAVTHLDFPHKYVVDIDHPKIFVAPHRFFMIGLCGEFLPERVNEKETWDLVATIFSLALAHHVNSGFSNGGIPLDDKKILDHYLKVFDRDGRLFIVDRYYRFVVKYVGQYKQLQVRIAGDYAGIGTGGMIAAGLAMRTPKLKDVFRVLHELDHYSSKEHTIVPISSLLLNKGLYEKMKVGRAKAHKSEETEE
jgi:hypothetical protein